MISSEKCFLKAQRGYVPEIAKVVLLLQWDLVMCKGHPGGTGFEGMKGSWRAVEVTEALWEAMEGHWWRCSLSWSWWPRTEGVMQRNWGLAPWREPMRGYWWSVVEIEDSSVLQMSVPWDDRQEQQHQWNTGSWSLEDKVCATKDRAGEVTQAFGGAQKIVSWIPDTGQLEFNFCFWLWLCPDIFPSWRKKVF